MNTLQSTLAEDHQTDTIFNPEKYSAPQQQAVTSLVLSRIQRFNWDEIGLESREATADFLREFSGVPEESALAALDEIERDLPRKSDIKNRTAYLKNIFAKVKLLLSSVSESVSQCAKANSASSSLVSNTDCVMAATIISDASCTPSTKSSDLRMNNSPGKLVARFQI